MHLFQNVTMEEYGEEKEKLHEELHEAAVDLKEAMYVSLIQLLIPLQLLIRIYFLKKTKRSTHVMM